jgi:cytidine deaminase
MPAKLNLTSSFTVYDSAEDLNDKDLQLFQRAKEALKNAYAPYSQFYVGAALLLENGVIVTGNNQENAAYPSGLCAERVALFHASSQYPDQKIITIAVSAASKNKVVNKPVSPCGACRQAISEYEIKFRSPVKMILGGESGEVYISDAMTNLLPLTFTSEDLK